MAGSWAHMTTAEGRMLRDTGGATETGGDAFETLEECFGMIWWLAAQLAGPETSAAAGPAVIREHALPWVRAARENYAQGVALGGREG